jgi:hypothetical protein
VPDSRTAFPFLVQGLCAVAVVAAVAVVITVAVAVVVTVTVAITKAVAVAVTDAAGHLKPVPIKTIELFHQILHQGSPQIVAPMPASN